VRCHFFCVSQLYGHINLQGKKAFFLLHWEFIRKFFVHGVYFPEVDVQMLPGHRAVILIPEYRYSEVNWVSIPVEIRTGADFSVRLSRGPVHMPTKCLFLVEWNLHIKICN
jgi:hypothetical protein